MSEQDLFHVIWFPCLHTTFEDSPVILTSGETQSSACNELVKLRGNEERGAFKVDLRAVLESINNENNKNIIKTYDLANCEVAKEGNIEKKNVVDHAKLMVKATVILDEISKLSRLSFKEAKKIGVINLLISGLKTVFVQMKYSHNEEGYIAQTFEKSINFPICRKNIKDFFTTSLPQQLLWKQRAEKNLNVLRDGLNADNSNFGPAPVKEGTSYIKPTCCHLKRPTQVNKLENALTPVLSVGRCRCGHPAAYREPFATCPLMEEILEELSFTFGTIPEFKQDMHPLDYVINHLPRSEIGLSRGK
ncbi:hypothetical protein BDA99DRAFT_286371 [Phascolomyces articulosus]|uniref:Uncharacterized protein n=1 Tax=Phascolomyces articulosus TaxID=60185 RepID=A0AAD5JMB4_9FUNG|nr:hypothetical protein BDA99DRAFT_286371 [Phascolomyces articulosus]